MLLPSLRANDVQTRKDALLGFVLPLWQTPIIFNSRLPQTSYSTCATHRKQKQGLARVARARVTFGPYYAGNVRLHLTLCPPGALSPPYSTTALSCSSLSVLCTTLPPESASWVCLHLGLCCSLCHSGLPPQRVVNGGLGLLTPQRVINAGLGFLN
jgi:hypothetical protein